MTKHPCTIKNTEQYYFALESIESLMDLDPGRDTVKGKRLCCIVDHIVVYEKIHFCNPDGTLK
jgi:antitoxin component HigA of HigAB toxin-antitoxin module